MTPLEEARWVLEHPDVIRSNPAWRELVRKLLRELLERDRERSFFT